MMQCPDKHALRTMTRAARKTIPAEERAALANLVAERVVLVAGPLKPHLVLGYAASAEELDPAPALECLASSGVQVALPRIAGPGTLSLHVVERAEDLEEGPFGIRQPHEDAPTVDEGLIDLVIVPGVVFDEHGHRIGFGGGYYDRLLARIPRAHRLGVAFDQQIVPEIPAEAHDERVDAVVTPTRTFLPPRRKSPCA